MWFQILATILGSGALSAGLTHFLTTRAAEKNFRRDKLEQLYLVAAKITKDSIENALHYRKGEQVSAYDLKDFEERRKGHDERFDTCSMLVNLYFPHLSRALVTFSDCWEKFIFGAGVTEEQLQQSGVEFINQIVFTARQMNKPRGLTLKGRFSRLGGSRKIA